MQQKGLLVLIILSCATGTTYYPLIDFPCVPAQESQFVNR